MKEYLAIIGPTASGKSALAMAISRHIPSELINCDSVQIYKGFDIGAAKPSCEELAEVPHHLIDKLRGDEDYDARSFARDAEVAIADIRSRGKLPIVVGGTGLYLKALWQDGFHDLPKSQQLREELKHLSPEDLRTRLDQLDPRRSEEIHGNDRFRLQRAVEVATLLGHSVKDLPPPASRSEAALVVSMGVPRAQLQEKIALRSRIMLEQGLLAEVETLLSSGVSKDAKPMQSIGYREAVRYLDGMINKAQLEEEIVIATRQYAKRQETLFKKLRKDLVVTPEMSLESVLEFVLRYFPGRA